MKNLKLKVPENSIIEISHEKGFKIVKISAKEFSFETDDLIEVEDKPVMSEDFEFETGV